MEKTVDHSNNDDRKDKETAQLASLLKEMKEGLDTVSSKIQFLTAKAKESQFPTADGFSYLEAKNLLLLNYCQSLVYYLLRKAKGFFIEGHPVVISIVEIKLYLEKVRPIDKKQKYQIQKLTKASESATKNVTITPRKESVGPDKSEDMSKYRPNPDMLVSKSDITSQDGGGVYRPPKFAPTSMEQDKTSKQERNALRRDKEILRQSRSSDFIKTLMDDMEDRPEDIRDFIPNSREVDRYIAKMEEQSRKEEELFTCAPRTKMDKKRENHLKKSRNGLEDLAGNFYDDIKTLPVEDKSGANHGVQSWRQQNWETEEEKEKTLKKENRGFCTKE